MFTSPHCPQPHTVPSHSIKMMHHPHNGHASSMFNATYAQDALLQDLARQMASSNTRRLSRGSTGHFMPGAMRVSKPSSANNSPRSSLIQARRRTIINDGLFARRGQQPLEQTHLPLSSGAPMVQDEPTKRQTRPVSWHPSSQHGNGFGASQPSCAHYYTLPHDTEPFPSYNQFPPTPAGYSGYTSPNVSFSPLSLPHASFDAPAYFSPNPWALNTRGLPSPGYSSLPLVSPSGSSTRQTGTSDEWDSFIANGFERATAPRTPESHMGLDKPSPVVPTEEILPGSALDDEPEGEILIGMGLYDPPEKDETDPTLLSYRTSVAHLLGSAYKLPEPTGKGLKLEDAWEPPETDEEDEEDADESAEDDAETDGNDE